MIKPPSAEARLPHYQGSPFSTHRGLVSVSSLLGAVSTSPPSSAMWGATDPSEPPREPCWWPHLGPVRVRPWWLQKPLPHRQAFTPRGALRAFKVLGALPSARGASVNHAEAPELRELLCEWKETNNEHCRK